MDYLCESVHTSVLCKWHYAHLKLYMYECVNEHVLVIMCAYTSAERLALLFYHKLVKPFQWRLWLKGPTALGSHPHYDSLPVAAVDSPGTTGNHQRYLCSKDGSGNLQAALICDLTEYTALTCDSHLIPREQLTKLPLQVFSSSNFQLSFQQTSEEYLSLVKKQWWKKNQRLLPSLRRPPHLVMRLSASPNRQTILSHFLPSFLLFCPSSCLSFSLCLSPFTLFSFSYFPISPLPSLNIDTSRYDCL